MKNHTATHLLNWALREVLCAPEERENPHVQQKGSLVDPEKTRFDFSHNKPVSAEELARIESLVNEKIEAELTVYTKEVDQAAAREINTLRAVFGEKYPDRVRVVRIGDFSTELCGGTHLSNSGQVGLCKIIGEEPVAKGVRRITALTGLRALANVRETENLLKELVVLLKTPQPQDLPRRIAVLQDELRSAKRELAK